MVEPCVKGRLANAFEFWEKVLEAPSFVIDIITQGYSVPFSEFPPRCFLSNNRSALRNPQFVESAILELLEKQLINEHSFPPHCVNPLTVAEGKKLRLVIDLREVNKYLVKPKFRYEELKFWLQHIDSFNGYSIRGVFSAESTIYTDASDFAFGGYLATLGGEPVRGMFSLADVHSSSTYRELKAVFYVLKSYADSLKHQRVKVFVDNMGASRILMVGSSKLHLQQIAVDIFSICLSFDISLDSQWLPREENARADLLSRFIDRDDWSLNPVVFQSLDARWGPHSVDRFSSYFNSQVVRFNSKYFSPGCAAVDALAQDWSSDNNWLCPPTHLIVAAVKHLRYHKGVGTIIIPEWPSASFWPFLHISPSRFHTFVKEFVVLPRLADLLIEGPGQREVYRKKPSAFVGCPSFNMLALRLDFR